VHRILFNERERQEREHGIEITGSTGHEPKGDELHSEKHANDVGWTGPIFVRHETESEIFAAKGTEGVPSMDGQSNVGSADGAETSDKGGDVIDAFVVIIREFVESGRSLL
jgi:hypothetical protein